MGAKTKCCVYNFDQCICIYIAKTCHCLVHCDHLPCCMYALSFFLAITVETFRFYQEFVCKLMFKKKKLKYKHLSGVKVWQLTLDSPTCSVYEILFWIFAYTYTIIQSITSSEMCYLHLTHPSAHTLDEKIKTENTDTKQSYCKQKNKKENMLNVSFAVGF